jgi:tRNA pseudouridine-54 N-methylase
MDKCEKWSYERGRLRGVLSRGCFRNSKFVSLCTFPILAEGSNIITLHRRGTKIEKASSISSSSHLCIFCLGAHIPPTVDAANHLDKPYVFYLCISLSRVLSIVCRLYSSYHYSLNVLSDAIHLRCWQRI